jgi:hypothetical protein
LYSGEHEFLVRRRTLAVLQDETRKVLDASRDLYSLYESLAHNDRQKITEIMQKIKNAENEVEALRRNLTRELAEVGAMTMNREDLLRVAYTIEEVVDYISAVAFRLSQLRAEFLRNSKLRSDLRELLDMAIISINKLNEAVLALSINPTHAIDIANSLQKEERDMDDRHRLFIAKILKEIDDIKSLLMLKDIVERIEEISDKCLQAGDAITILALGL